jgi:hypothetical protein
LRPNGALIVQKMSSVGDVHDESGCEKTGKPRLRAANPLKSKEWQVSAWLQV